MSAFKSLVDRVSRELQDETSRKLREYLLGGLSARQRAAIDRRMVEDQEFFEELQAAEDALIEDHLNGTLPADHSERFRKLVRTSASWAEKLRFAQALRRVIDKQGRAPVSAVDLFESTYAELQDIAGRMIRREGPDVDPDPSSLVHEAFLRLSGERPRQFQDRLSFFAMASSVMRRVLVDMARSHRALKKGGRESRFPPSEQPVDAPTADDRLLEIDQALEELTRIDPRLSRIVELKFFAGLSLGEIAEALQVSERTVKRDWALARTWLHDYLNPHRTVQ